MRNVFLLAFLCPLLPAAELLAEAAAVPVKGRIVDEEGNPLEGVAVKGGGARCTTGKDGTFSFRAPPGPFQLSFENLLLPGEPWHRSLRGPKFPRTLLLEEGAGRDLGDWVYRRHGCLLAGTARDAAGNPLPGARVALATDEGLFLSVARSGADGAWSLRAPLASSAARSFNLRLWPGEDSCPDVLELDALRIWETNAVELRASATRSRIEGVLNLEGAGLSGAQILLYRKGQKSAATFYPPASTDAGGRFAFERVPEGAYVLEVVHPRAGRASFPAPCPGEPLRLEVPAAPGGAVECFLKISVDGKPVADATAARKAADGVSPALFAAGTDGRPRSPLVPLAIGEVREGGWFFRVENLPEGDHAFVFLDVGAVKGPEALKDVDEATFPLWGGLFLHEGRRAIPSDPPLSKIGIELKAKVRRGETAKIDVRREFTAKEVLAWQELASR